MRKSRIIFSNTPPRSSKPTPRAKSKTTFPLPKPQYPNSGDKKFIQLQIPHFETLHINGRKVDCQYLKCIHSIDGPAIRYDSGNWYWYKHGILHRDDGPAVCINGDYQWFNNGVLHREDGPAFVRTNGEEYWYIDGVQVDPIQLDQTEETILDEMKDVVE